MSLFGLLSNRRGERMKGLLDVLWSGSELPYVSDLKGKLEDEKIKSMLKEHIKENYELAEWNDTLLYLGATKKNFNSLDDVYVFINSL